MNTTTLYMSALISLTEIDSIRKSTVVIALSFLYIYTVRPPSRKIFIYLDRCVRIPRVQSMVVTNTSQKYVCKVSQCLVQRHISGNSLRHKTVKSSRTVCYKMVTN